MTLEATNTSTETTSGSEPSPPLQLAQAGWATTIGEGVADRVGTFAANGAVHDGTTQPQLDVSQGLISALGGQVLHPLEFEGAEITPTQSGSGIVLDEPNETNPTSGMTTWLSHPSNIGYTRQSSSGNTIGGSGGSSNAIAPTQDSGTSNGSSQDELERLLNFNGGAVQNPTSTQAAPISPGAAGGGR